ncbi:MAG: radical SAM protein [Planctomycetes bacterium]|nr:radical SAM protein [Planctomycetota bacterium]
MRVLLLNPPGERIYIRDYFCSKTTKSNYLFHPIDLVMLSGIVASRHEVAVLDAIAERLGVEAARARIEAFAPDAIVSLVGSVSWPEDRAFLSEQAARGRRVLAIGDVLHEKAALRVVEETWLEAALGNFVGADALKILERRYEDVHDSVVRREDGRVEVLHARGKLHGSYSIPRPRHELFPRSGYHFSFARSEPFATILTDWGCPFPCTFCVMSTLGYATRPIADVLEEVDHLRARGVRELFVMDQTFGVQRKRALELCAAWAERGDLSWTTYARPDRIDDELCSALARAGCHTLMMGVESADPAVLASYEKRYDTADVRAGFARAKRHGLRTVGTFIIGLPEETEESIRASLDLALELELDFMSLNMAVPRFGTPFRRRAIELGLVDEDDLVMDQGGAEAKLPTQALDRATMLALKKRMVRRFYLRPSYLWRRVTAARSLFELRAQAREGLALLFRNV